jgi:hypothetical protein
MTRPDDALLDLVVGEVADLFDGWVSGRVYIARGAYYAMLRRFTALDNAPALNGFEALELARLFAFFELVHHFDPPPPPLWMS